MSRTEGGSYCRALGVRIDPLDANELAIRMSGAIRNSTGLVVAGHNLHSVYLYHTDRLFRAFYDSASIVLADGAPLLWDYSLSGHDATGARLGSTDWVPEFCKREYFKSVLVIGASEESNTKCVGELTALSPNCAVRGIPGEDWNSDKENAALSQVVQQNPELVLIGLGMPLQERFASRLVALDSSIVIATVGGAIDQIAGAQINAPRWLGRFGLEWLWRLISQPRRLWRRYLIEPWQLLGVRAYQVLKRKVSD